MLIRFKEENGLQVVCDAVSVRKGDRYVLVIDRIGNAVKVVRDKGEEDYVWSQACACWADSPGGMS